MYLDGHMDGYFLYNGSHLASWQSHVILAPRYDRTPARQGLEAADAAIDVFNSLHTGEYLSVIGNGDPLEGQ
eukprot:SAG31_NODE_2493_length_5611_cov_8.195755_3_plen_72_part_00